LLQKSIVKEKGGETRNYQDVSILVSASVAEKVTFILSYVTKNASWIATYDVRVAIDNTIHVTYNGLVKQNTPDEWKNVDLSLSTANPSIGGAPPELKATKLKFFIPEYTAYKAGRSHGLGFAGLPFTRMESSKMMSMDAPALPQQPVKIMTAEVATKSAAATSALFKITRKTTIGNDNNEHKVAITVVELKGDFKYTVVPKLAERAYLRAKVLNSSNFPLLKGKAIVFFGNTFNCESSIPASSPQEKFKIALGTDPSVSVVYKSPHKYHEESGIVSKSRVQRLAFETTIKNSKRITIPIKVLDQVPLSSYDTIKVKLQVPDLHITREDVILKKDNNVKWTKKLAAGEQWVIPLKYTIEHPKEQDIYVEG